MGSVRGVGTLVRPAAWTLNQRRDITSWLARWFPKTPAKSVVALKTPIKVELVAGKTYRWCVCGRSKKQLAQNSKPHDVVSVSSPGPEVPLCYRFAVDFEQVLMSMALCCLPPFCDGSHFFKRTGLSPLKFKAQETRTVALCTCKATQKPPYCDGTHRSEQVQKAELGSSL